MGEIDTGATAMSEEDRELARRIRLVSDQTGRAPVHPDPELQAILDELTSQQEKPVRQDDEGPEAA